MSGVALYVIAAEYRENLDRLAEQDLDPQTLRDTIEAMSGAMEDKSTAVAMVIRNAEATIGAMKEAEAGIAKRRKAAEKHVADLTEYLRANMERCGITKIESPHLRLTIRTNPGAVVIDDEQQIPPFFWRTPPAPPPPEPVIDKIAIKKAVADGEVVPGARVVQTTRLEIK